MSEMNVTIREMRWDDAPAFAAAECEQGWNASPEKLEVHLRDCGEEKCAAIVAELDGERAGYVCVYWNPEHGPFVGKGWPEIVDFNVLEKFRRRGIGSKLMDAAEALASTRADRVTIGVGMHNGYGSAQRMYVKRGYVPDGSGVWFQGAVCEPYGDCKNDDELVLYLSKDNH